MASVNLITSDKSISEYCFDFIRSASREWLESSYTQRLELQKLIFEKPIPFDGEKFGTPELSLIYGTKKAPVGEPSNLVASRGIEPLLTA